MTNSKLFVYFGCGSWYRIVSNYDIKKEMWINHVSFLILNLLGNNDMKGGIIIKYSVKRRDLE